MNMSYQQPRTHTAINSLTKLDCCFQFLQERNVLGTACIQELQNFCNGQFDFDTFESDILGYFDSFSSCIDHLEESLPFLQGKSDILEQLAEHIKECIDDVKKDHKRLRDNIINLDTNSGYRGAGSVARKLTHKSTQQVGFATAANDIHHRDEGYPPNQTRLHTDFRPNANNGGIVYEKQWQQEKHTIQPVQHPPQQQYHHHQQQQQAYYQQDQHYQQYQHQQYPQQQQQQLTLGREFKPQTRGQHPDSSTAKLQYSHSHSHSHSQLTSQTWLQPSHGKINTSHHLQQRLPPQVQHGQNSLQSLQSPRSSHHGYPYDRFSHPAIPLPPATPVAPPAVPVAVTPRAPALETGATRRHTVHPVVNAQVERSSAVFSSSSAAATTTVPRVAVAPAAVAKQEKNGYVAGGQCNKNSNFNYPLWGDDNNNYKEGHEESNLSMIETAELNNMFKQIDHDHGINSSTRGPVTPGMNDLVFANSIRSLPVVPSNHNQTATIGISTISGTSTAAQVREIHQTPQVPLAVSDCDYNYSTNKKQTHQFAPVSSSAVKINTDKFEELHRAAVTAKTGQDKNGNNIGNMTGYGGTRSNGLREDNTRFWLDDAIDVSLSGLKLEKHEKSERSKYAKSWFDEMFNDVQTLLRYKCGHDQQRLMNYRLFWLRFPLDCHIYNINTSSKKNCFLERQRFENAIINNLQNHLAGFEWVVSYWTSGDEFTIYVIMDARSEFNLQKYYSKYYTSKAEFPLGKDNWNYVFLQMIKNNERQQTQQQQQQQLLQLQQQLQQQQQQQQACHNSENNSNGSSTERWKIDNVFKWMNSNTHKKRNPKSECILKSRQFLNNNFDLVDIEKKLDDATINNINDIFSQESDCKLEIYHLCVNHNFLNINDLIGAYLGSLGSRPWLKKLNQCWQNTEITLIKQYVLFAQILAHFEQHQQNPKWYQTKFQSSTFWRAFRYDPYIRHYFINECMLLEWSRVLNSPQSIPHPKCIKKTNQNNFNYRRDYIHIRYENGQKKIVSTMACGQDGNNGKTRIDKPFIIWGVYETYTDIAKLQKHNSKIETDGIVSEICSFIENKRDNDLVVVEKCFIDDNYKLDREWKAAWVVQEKCMALEDGFPPGAGFDDQFNDA